MTKVAVTISYQVMLDVEPHTWADYRTHVRTSNDMRLAQDAGKKIKGRALFELRQAMVAGIEDQLLDHVAFDEVSD
jgi:hypothetical protein